MNETSNALNLPLIAGIAAIVYPLRPVAEIAASAAVVASEAPGLALLAVRCVAASAMIRVERWLDEGIEK